MSTFILKSIAINEKDRTVHLTGHDSNVFPATPKRFESTYLSELLQTQGREALDAYMLEQYAGGMIRGGNNDYSNTLALYNEATLENLTKLRQLKNEMKGRKFLILINGKYVFNITKRSAKTTSNRHMAQSFDIISAMVRSKHYKNAEIIPA